MNAPVNPAAFVIPELTGKTAAILVDMDREAFDGWHGWEHDAPMAFRCGGCDAYRKTVRAFCPNCEGVTESWVEGGAIYDKADFIADAEYRADRRAYQARVL